MSYKIDNAIIMAAGMSSRFGPIALECPKALLEVKGEVLIERQIRQLMAAGVPQIVIVVGYMKEKFEYLQEKYGAILVENPDYAVRNNHSSIYAAREYLKNSYVCSADNYFSVNPFQIKEAEAFYAAIYVEGRTKEWCITVDDNEYIKKVVIGGDNAWIMLGHTFWSEKFSEKFLEILKCNYDTERIKTQLWESIYLDNIAVLRMKIKKYSADEIHEFDSLEELQEFDKTYQYDYKNK